MPEAKIFVLPRGAGLLESSLDLLRVLMVQGILRPGSFRYVVGEEAVGAFLVRSLGEKAEDDHDEEIAAWIVRQRSDFTLINVVTADSLAGAEARRSVPFEDFKISGEEGMPVAELADAVAVEALIRNAIADGVDLAVINLVVPAAQESSIPWDLWWRGRGANYWVNAVVAPEVQIAENAPSVLVDSDEDYVAHLVASLLLLGGGWSGADLAGDLVTAAQEGAEPRPHEWLLLKTRSRSITAPELPRRVLRRVGEAARELPIDPSGAQQYAIDIEPDRTVAAAVDGIVGRYSLSASRQVDTSYTPPRSRRIGIREFISILTAWASRRIPEMVADEVVHRIRSLRERAESYVNGFLGLDVGSSIRIGWGEDSDTTAAAGPPGGEGQAVRSRRGSWSAPEPAIWEELRSTSFGLLDGGPLADEQLAADLVDGPRRIVLAKPERICPAPDHPIWEPAREVAGLMAASRERSHIVDVDWFDAWERLLEQATASSGAGATSEDVGPVSSEEQPPAPASSTADPSVSVDDAPSPASELARLRAARLEANGSLLWRLAEQLVEARKGAQEYMADVEGQLAEAEAVTPEQVAEERRKGRRSLRRRGLIGLAILVVVAVALSLGVAFVFTGVFTGVLLVVAAVVAGIAWMFGLLRVTWSWAYGSFLLEHRLHWIEKSRREILLDAQTYARGQLARFENLVEIERDWSDVIGSIVYHPFGSPSVKSQRRIYDADLGLPVSQKVTEGFTAPDRLRAVTRVFLMDEAQPGWLTRSYGRAANYAEQAYLGPEGGRLPGMLFSPDLDMTPAGHPQSARRELVGKVRNGEARQWAELALRCRIESGLRDPSFFHTQGSDELVDFLFTPDYRDGFSASSFLGEAKPGASERPQFNAGLAHELRGSRANDKATVTLATVTQVALKWTPPPVEAVLQGQKPDFPLFGFASLAVLGYVGVPTEEISLFSLDASLTPVSIDLTRANDRWKPPPDECRGREVITAGADFSGWVAGDAPYSIGETIARPARVVQPAPNSGPFSFLYLEGGEPLCYPQGTQVKVAVRSDFSPPNVFEVLGAALQCLSDSVVLEFVYDGTFEGVPDNSTDRIEVAWLTEEEFMSLPEFSTHPRAVGFGGPRWSQAGDGRTRIVGGVVRIRASMADAVEFDVESGHGITLLHELGHAMNLGHVNDSTQIMNEWVATPSGPELDYGIGDRLGLWGIHLAGDAS